MVIASWSKHASDTLWRSVFGELDRFESRFERAEVKDGSVCPSPRGRREFEELRQRGRHVRVLLAPGASCNSMWRYGSEHHLRKHMKTTSLTFTTVRCFSATLATKLAAKRPFIKTNNYRTANRLGKQQWTAVLWCTRETTSSAPLSPQTDHKTDRCNAHDEQQAKCMK